MCVTWVTFGYNDWQAIHSELGRSVWVNLMHPACSHVLTEFSEHQHSTKTWRISRKVVTMWISWNIDGISLNFQNQLMNSVRLVVAWQTWLMTGIPNLISNCTRLAITLIIFFIRSLTGKIYHHRPPRGHLKQWDTHYVITSVVIHTNNCSIKSPILDTLLQRSKTSGISIPTSSARWGGIYTHAVDFASFIFSFQPNTDRDIPIALTWLNQIPLVQPTSRQYCKSCIIFIITCFSCVHCTIIVLNIALLIIIARTLFLPSESL